MIQIRKSIFETNSSMTHAMVICSKEEFEKWKNGELLYDRYNNCFANSEQNNNVDPEDEEDLYDKKFLSYDEYEYLYDDHESDLKNYTTKHGDEIVILNHIGYDG